MSRNVIALLYFSECSYLKRKLIKTRKKKKKCTKKEKHPYGEHEHFQPYESVKDDPEAFQDYFHMSQKTFNYILNLVEQPLKKENTNFRKSISPEIKLMVTLRFLITGASYRTLAETFKLGVSSISGIVRDVCEALYMCLTPVHMPIPTAATFLTICETYRLRWDFPNCLGCIDSRHIRLKTPFRLYETKITGLVLHISVDANYRIIMFDTIISTEDYEPTFRDGVFFRKLCVNEFDLPSDVKGDFKEILTGEGVIVSGLPFVFLGDDSCPLLDKLLKPFPQRSMDAGKSIFNEKTARARESVDATFDQLTYRWGVLTKIIETTTENAQWIIRAAVILHNCIIDIEGINMKEITFIRANRSELHLKLNEGFAVTRANNNFSHKARRVRENYVDYFINCNYH